MTAASTAPVKEPGRKQLFRARTLAELLADPDILKPPTAVIPYLAWPGRITLLAGREKSGKSTLAGQGVAELSRGGAFLSANLQAARVLCLALDEPIQDLVQRLHRYGAGAENVMIVDGVIDSDGLRNITASFRPAVVVIDCLANLALGTVRDPGNAMDWGELFSHLRALAADFNVAIILIHHAKKDGTVYRDSTAIGAQADMILTMRESPDQVTRRVVEVKGRLAQRSYAVDFQGDRYELDGEPATGHPGDDGTAAIRQLLEVLAGAEPDGLPTTRWEKAAGIPSTSFYRCRQKLLDDGLITVEKQGRIQRNRPSARGRSRLRLLAGKGDGEDDALDENHEFPF
jgi:hypothetical protein